MYKPNDFVPFITAALIVILLALGGLIQSDTCSGDWTCWFAVPLKILVGIYTPPANAHWLLIFAQQVGKIVLIAGAVVSTVQVGISAARHDFRAALARRKKHHTVVCGFGKTGLQVVQNMRAAGHQVVVIDRSDDAVNIAFCDREGIPVIKGDATSTASLRAAGTLRARNVVVCTGDDASNMDAALRIKEMVAGRDRAAYGKLGVIAEMRDQWLYARLIDHERQPLGSNDVGFQLFNTYDNAARLLVRSLHLPPGPEVAPGAFIVIGFGTMGQQLTLQMVRAAPARLDAKTRIVIVDRAADTRQTQFLHSYPAIADFADLQFVGTDMSLDTPQAWDAVEKIIRDGPLLGIAVCLSDDQASLYAGLNLRRLLDGLARIHVPVFVRLEQHAHLGQFAASMTQMKGPRDRLRVFGGIEELLQPDILIAGELDRLAMAFHAHWLESVPAQGNTSPAARPWDMLAETFKMANRRRADLVPIHLAQAGLKLISSATPQILEFDAQEVETLARLEHRRWLIDRRLLGVAYGETRSDILHTHQSVVEWERLPESVREANRNEVRSLAKILAAVKMEIRRERKVLVGDGTPGAAEQAVTGTALQSSAGDARVVIADIDAVEGRKAAEAAVAQPDATLWLMSRDFPECLPHSIVAAPFWEAAAGWVSCEQLRGAVGGKGSEPDPGKSRPKVAQQV